MKTFLILAFLAMTVTMSTANVQFDPTWQFQPQQPFSQEQQQPIIQQLLFLQQQLNSCRQFLVQQCIPVPIVPFLQSRILQQSSCQVTRQQCCRQLVQIPEQIRSPAIHSIVHAIILQQQQQQQQQFGQGQQFGQRQQFGQGQQSFVQPQQQQGFFQPQGFLIPQQQQQGIFGSQQQQVVQGFIQPQQIAQFEALRTFALQTLPAICNVQVPPYYFTNTNPSGGF